MERLLIFKGIFTDISVISASIVHFAVMHLCYLNNCDGLLLSNGSNDCDICDIYGDGCDICDIYSDKCDIYGDGCDIYVISHVYSDGM